MFDCQPFTRAQIVPQKNHNLSKLERPITARYYRKRMYVFMSSVCHFCPISPQSVRMHRLQQKPQIWNVKKRALWESWRPMRTDTTGRWSLFATASRTRLKIDSLEQQTKSDSWPICTAGTSGEWSWSAKQQTATFSASSSLLLHVWCIPVQTAEEPGIDCSKEYISGFTTTSRRHLKSTGPTVQWVHVTSVSKAAGAWNWVLSLPTATIKNVWNLTSTSYVP